MVDTVIFTNKAQTSVKVEPEGWNMPYPSKTWHQARIDQWEEGRTDEWDAQKEAYDHYMLIMGYDYAMAQHEGNLAQCQADYTACRSDVINDTGECESALQSCLISVVRPVKPNGYNTQEEVDASILAHDDWVVAEYEYTVDPENTEPYPIVEPQILKLPADLPVIPEPPALIPNIIPDYVKPVNEVRAEKLAEIQSQFNIEANAEVISNGQTWNGGIANALAINGDADLQSHRGRPEATIHSKDHMSHTMSVNAIKDVAADIGEAYDVVNAKLHVKLKEVSNCGDNAACIITVTW